MDHLDISDVDELIELFEKESKMRSVENPDSDIDSDIAEDDSSLDLIEEYYNSGYDLSLPVNEDAETLIFIASKFGSDDVISFLIDIIPVNCLYDIFEGQTPLMAYCSNSNNVPLNTRVLEKYLKAMDLSSLCDDYSDYFDDVNMSPLSSRDGDNKNAIMLLLENEKPCLSSLLVLLGVEPDHTDREISILHEIYYNCYLKSIQHTGSTSSNNEPISYNDFDYYRNTGVTFKPRSHHRSLFSSGYKGMYGLDVNAVDIDGDNALCVYLQSQLVTWVNPLIILALVRAGVPINPKRPVEESGDNVNDNSTRNNDSNTANGTNRNNETNTGSMYDNSIYDIDDLYLDDEDDSDEDDDSDYNTNDSITPSQPLLVAASRAFPSYVYHVLLYCGADIVENRDDLRNSALHVYLSSLRRSDTHLCYSSTSYLTWESFLKPNQKIYPSETSSKPSSVIYDIIKLFILTGNPVTAADCMEKLPLMVYFETIIPTTSNIDLDIVKLLIYGSPCISLLGTEDINQVKPLININHKDYEGRTILYYFCKRIHQEKPRQCSLESSTTSQFHFADLSVFQFLLKVGLNLFVVDREEQTVLHWFISTQPLDVKLLERQWKFLPSFPNNVQVKSETSGSGSMDSFNLILDHIMRQCTNIH